MIKSVNKPEPMLWLDSVRGIYIPRDFANYFSDPAKHVFGVTKEDWQTLQDGPDNEWYWEAWENVCRDCFVNDETGTRYTVYQDGDCWLIPAGMEWSDKDEWFHWPE